MLLKHLYKSGEEEATESGIGLLIFRKCGVRVDAKEAGVGTGETLGGKLGVLVVLLPPISKTLRVVHLLLAKFDRPAESIALRLLLRRNLLRVAPQRIIAYHRLTIAAVSVELAVARETTA